ncbi:Meiotic nuclear division protein 1 [Coelomomyces lativittatus]|nr:Meiotic nuclear division protein 1 [Coelomomyces lativittatus]
MPPRGISYEEKRKRLLELFYETKDIFQLKDLEKIAPKNKGIVSQSVKEVLQSLVDDDMVCCERIGTSNYFWSFPGHSAVRKQKRLKDLQTEIQHTTKQLAQLEVDEMEALKGKEPSDERNELLTRLAELEEKNQKLKDRLMEFQDNDPETFKAMQKSAKIAKEAIQRWIDNMYILQSYCVNTFGMERSTFNAQFGVTDEFENF